MRTTIINCQQGGAAWLEARRGMPTASRFKDFITPGGKLARNETARKYMAQLVYERISGKAADNYVTDAMQRGTELEPHARDWYTLATGREVRQVGFVRAELDGGAVCGASPDGLCDDRGVEIKVPLPHTTILQFLADDPYADYLMQIQGCMWICDMPQWDLVIYSGDSAIPNRIFTVQADRTLHAAFTEHVPAFCRELDAATARLVEMGASAWMAPPEQDGIPEMHPPAVDRHGEAMSANNNLSGGR